VDRGTVHTTQGVVRALLVTLITTTVREKCHVSYFFIHSVVRLTTGT
jgi:hypothetical protein